MKKCLTILGLLTSGYCFSQCDQHAQFNLSSISAPLYKVTDTVDFKAELRGIGKVSQTLMLQKLQSRKLIKKDEYKTAINFKIIGSDSAYYLPYKDVDAKVRLLLYQNQASGRNICMRAVLYRGFQHFNNKAFFLIEKIWFE